MGRPKGTGSLYRQRKNGVELPTWWCQYYINGQRRREFTETGDRKQAEKIMMQKIAEAMVNGDPAPASLTVKNLVATKLRRDRNNGLKDLKSPEGRWRLHLEPLLGKVRVRDLKTAMLEQYIAHRKAEGALPASVNREMALVRSAFHLAKKAGTLRDVPYFPMLAENNTRKGFLRDEQYQKLAEATMREGLWLRTAFEIAHSYGWRKTEIFGLRLKQLDFVEGTIRLDYSKNSEGRLVFMTSKVRELLLACCSGKTKYDDFVLTRDGQRVVDFRRAWANATKAAGCEGLLLHDLRRTGVRNLRRLGISESVAMKISGHKSSATFRRYDITDEADLREVTKKLDAKQGLGQGQAQEQPQGEGQKSAILSAIPKRAKAGNA